MAGGPDSSLMPWRRGESRQREREREPASAGGHVLLTQQKGKIERAETKELYARNLMP